MDSTTIRNRRLLTLATAALLAVGAGACSSSKSTSASGPAAESSQAGPVSMEFWGWAPYEKIVDEWNAAHPNTKVTFKKVPSGGKGGYTQITDAITAGKGPCLAQIEYQNIPSMLVKNSVMDITQYASDGILVNTVAPGSIDTPRQASNRQRQADVTGASLEEISQARVRDIPLRRLGKPQEVANVIAFLASECSSYITGSCITIDGGVVRGI